MVILRFYSNRAQSKIMKGNLYGVVIYTGEDTKIMKGIKKPAPKRSKSDQEVNYLSKLLFFVMVIGACILIATKGFGPSWGIQLTRYIILLGSIIPLSLKLNQNLSKLYYTKRINSDKDMKGVMAKTSMIPEDLGRISYVIADKTGTLTLNEMKVKQIALDNGEKFAVDEVESVDRSDNFYQFMDALMTCHNVTPSKKDDGFGFLELDSLSPDEVSFLRFASKFGFKLEEKDDVILRYKYKKGEEEVKVEYKVLQNFKFSFKRKKMGLIVQEVTEQKRIFYFVKGADSVLVPKLTLDKQMIAQNSSTTFATKGLRTLVFAKKELTLSEYAQWRTVYETCKISLKRREQKMEQCIDKLEKSLAFVGVTLSYFSFVIGNGS